MGNFLRSALLAFFLTGTVLGSTVDDVCLLPILMPKAKVNLIPGESTERVEIEYLSDEATALQVNEFFVDWFRKAASPFANLNDPKLKKYIVGLKGIFVEVNINASRYGVRTNQENKVTVIMRRMKSRIVVTVADQSRVPFDPRNADDHRNKDLRHRYCDRSEPNVEDAIVRVFSNRLEDGGYPGDSANMGRGICMIEEQMDPNRTVRIVDKLDWFEATTQGIPGTGVIIDVDFANWANLLRVQD